MAEDGLCISHGLYLGDNHFSADGNSITVTKEMGSLLMEYFSR
jgi:hypothetical protein